MQCTARKDNSDKSIKYNNYIIICVWWPQNRPVSFETLKISTCRLHYMFMSDVICIWLSAKRCANGGSDFWLSIKSVSNTLCVHNWSVSQWKQYEPKSGTAGEILFFESEQRHEIWPLKTDTLMVSTFDAFIHVHDVSKHYLSHRFAQRRYRFTQYI